MNRTNRHNATIHTYYGEVDVEFDVIWTMDSSNNWCFTDVDIVDLPYDSTVEYDTVRSDVRNFAQTYCDPFGGQDEDPDYAD
jgi:hypothetical protein